MIALVGCCKTKLSYTCEAKNMYCSSLFKKTKKLIELNSLNWFILSAKYGLIENNKIIDPYDSSLKSFSLNELKKWSFDVYQEIKNRKLNNLIFYCGSKYHNNYLIELLNNNNICYRIPMKGLSLGQRLSYLNKEIIAKKGFLL